MIEEREKKFLKKRGIIRRFPAAADTLDFSGGKETNWGIRHQGGER